MRVLVSEIKVLKSCATWVLLLICTAATAEPASREQLQFHTNAKLAGRALACGDRAGHASLRAASRRLAGLLPDSSSVKDYMAQFDKQVRLQQRFASRAKASNKASVCERVAEELEKNLGYSQIVAPVSEPAQ